MASWADVAKATQTHAAQAATPVDGQQHVRTCVVDANAIISAMRLEQYCDRAVTIEEVAREVRDKQSRQFLDTLAVHLEIVEPDEDSIRAVMTFARATGDLSTLSRPDIRLIALTRMLEIRAHGDAHLRTHPAPARTLTKPRRRRGQLPGWGTVDNAEDWRVVDEAGDVADAEHQSRIISNPAPLSSGQGAAEGAVDLATGAAAVGGSATAVNGQHAAEQDAGINVGHTENGDAAAAAGSGGSDDDDDSDGDDDDDGSGDDGEWQTAASSRNATRRRERRAMRRAHMPADSNAASTCHDADSVGAWDGVDDGTDDASVADDDSTAAVQRQSSVTCVTADFAMQNVLLQMGLCIMAPNGVRITRLSRFALRCHACCHVTKEAERVFCPACGNATLEKVEVFVGAGGVEHYGVRKNHSLRGTKFSLPKPRGGRAARQPILREDVLMQKQRRGRKPAPAVDPFAPEYDDKSWHTLTGNRRPGVTALVTNHKNNPNERKSARSNRRR